MQQFPDIVTDVHADFIRAGAKTLSLNTYSATPTRLREQGLNENIGAIHQQAFQALERAIDATSGNVDIAGCLGPLPGSYRGQPARTFDDLYDEYAILVRLQARADVLLIETMSNTLEAKAASAAACELGKPFGVAYRIEADGRLRSGESLMQAVAAVRDYAPTAIMLNCCDPEHLTSKMRELASLYPIVGGYANAFRSVEALAAGGSVDLLEAREDVSPQAYLESVRQWLADDARVVGGCCEITPGHLTTMGEALGPEFELIRFSQL
jgi:S-methylmethionine-dependent homocysteine/selenocysteine methylase